MEPEIIIGALAIFVSGGAMGAAGILLCQWVVGRISPPSQGRSHLGGSRDVEAMRADVADLALQLHSVDARLDFTEQLLGGALSGSRPPESLPPPQHDPAKGEGTVAVDTPPLGEAGLPEGERDSLEADSMSR